MQQLTAPPRQNLTREQVLGLLTAAAPTWDVGAEVLDLDLKYQRDISTAIDTAKVKRTMSADIHGTCSVGMRSELTWGAVLLRLYTVVSDRPVNPTLSARFNAGVFALVTPQRRTGTQPLVWDVTGFDRLYLLKRQVGNTYTVEAGTRYLDAVRAVIAISGLSASTVLLDSAAADKTLPQPMTWPLIRSTADTSFTSTGDVAANETTDIAATADTSPTTWLRVCNDLLAAVGYRGLWCDENGLFRSEPYVPPTQRTSEWTLTIGGVAREIHAAVDAELTRDEYGLPNRWVFVMRSPSATPSEGSGVYTVTDPEGVQRRGGLIWPVQVDLDAADQQSLQAQGDARVAADKRVAQVITRQTRPFPAVGHADVMTIIDPALGGSFRVQTSTWEQDLTGGNTAFEWSAIT